MEYFKTHLFNKKFFISIINDDIDEVERQLLEGSNPNICDDEGSYPIHIATRHGHESIVELLLESGADPTIKDVKGCNALHIASKERHAHLIPILVKCPFSEKAPNIKNLANVPSSSGDYPLHISADHASIKCVKKLLDLGADPMSRDTLGNTPLHRLILKPMKNISKKREERWNMVALALINKMDVNAMNNLYETPLHLARANQYPTIAQNLMNAGAINYQSKKSPKPVKNIDPVKDKAKDTFSLKSQENKAKGGITAVNANSTDRPSRGRNLSPRDASTENVVQRLDVSPSKKSVIKLHVQPPSLNNSAENLGHLSFGEYGAPLINQVPSSNIVTVRQLKRRKKRDSSPSGFYSEGGGLGFYVSSDAPKAFSRSDKNGARQRFVKSRPVSIERPVGDFSYRSIASLPDLSEAGWEKMLKRREEWSQPIFSVMVPVGKDKKKQNTNSTVDTKSIEDKVPPYIHDNTKKKLLYGQYAQPYKSFGKIETKVDALEAAMMENEYNDDDYEDEYIYDEELVEDWVSKIQGVDTYPKVTDNRISFTDRRMSSSSIEADDVYNKINQFEDDAANTILRKPNISPQISDSQNNHERQLKTNDSTKITIPKQRLDGGNPTQDLKINNSQNINKSENKKNEVNINKVAKPAQNKASPSSPTKSKIPRYEPPSSTVMVGVIKKNEMQTITPENIILADSSDSDEDNPFKNNKDNSSFNENDNFKLQQSESSLKPNDKTSKKTTSDNKIMVEAAKDINAQDNQKNKPRTPSSSSKIPVFNSQNSGTKPTISGKDNLNVADTTNNDSKKHIAVDKSNIKVNDSNIDLDQPKASKKKVPIDAKPNNTNMNTIKPNLDKDDSITTPEKSKYHKTDSSIDIKTNDSNINTNNSKFDNEDTKINLDLSKDKKTKAPVNSKLNDKLINTNKPKIDKDEIQVHLDQSKDTQNNVINNTKPYITNENTNKPKTDIKKNIINSDQTKGNKIENASINNKPNDQDILKNTPYLKDNTCINLDEDVEKKVSDSTENIIMPSQLADNISQPIINNDGHSDILQNPIKKKKSKDSKKNIKKDIRNFVLNDQMEENKTNPYEFDKNGCIRIKKKPEKLSIENLVENFGIDKAITDEVWREASNDQPIASSETIYDTDNYLNYRDTKNSDILKQNKLTTPFTKNDNLKNDDLETIVPLTIGPSKKVKKEKKHGSKTTSLTNTEELDVEVPLPVDSSKSKNKIPKSQVNISNIKPFSDAEVEQLKTTTKNIVNLNGKKSKETSIDDISKDLPGMDLNFEVPTSDTIKPYNKDLDNNKNINKPINSYNKLITDPNIMNKETSTKKPDNETDNLKKTIVDENKNSKYLNNTNVLTDILNPNDNLRQNSLNQNMFDNNDQINIIVPNKYDNINNGILTDESYIVYTKDRETSALEPQSGPRKDTTIEKPFKDKAKPKKKKKLLDDKMTTDFTMQEIKEIKKVTDEDDKIHLSKKIKDKKKLQDNVNPMNLDEDLLNKDKKRKEKEILTDTFIVSDKTSVSTAIEENKKELPDSVKFNKSKGDNISNSELLKLKKADVTFSSNESDTDERESDEYLIHKETDNDHLINSIKKPITGENIFTNIQKEKDNNFEPNVKPSNDKILDDTAKNNKTLLKDNSGALSTDPVKTQKNLQQADSDNRVSSDLNDQDIFAENMDEKVKRFRENVAQHVLNPINKRKISLKDYMGMKGCVEMLDESDELLDAETVEDELNNSENVADHLVDTDEELNKTTEEQNKFLKEKVKKILAGRNKSIEDDDDDDEIEDHALIDKTKKSTVKTEDTKKKKVPTATLR